MQPQPNKAYTADGRALSPYARYASPALPREPWTARQHAWAGGYRAGYYPDDREEMPDIGTDAWEAWMHGYFAGCEAHATHARLGFPKDALHLHATERKKPVYKTPPKRKPRVDDLDAYLAEQARKRSI